MDKKALAYDDWKNGMKYKDIAEKYEVSLSAVKSWASRDWKKKSCDNKKKKVATNSKEKLQPKPRGAPKGNKNAVGNSGGAPLGNSNAQTHGGYCNRYSKTYWDFLEEDEEDMLQEFTEDEEELLLEQIKLFTVRERYLMRIIRNEKDKAKGGQVISSIMRIENKVEFKDETEKELYEDIRQEKIAEKKMSYLGHNYQNSTSTENVLKIIKDLEGELTRIQRAKTQAIGELQKLRLERKKSQENQTGDELINEWIDAVTGGEEDE